MNEEKQFLLCVECCEPAPCALCGWDSYVLYFNGDRFVSGIENARLFSGDQVGRLYRSCVHKNRVHAPWDFYVSTIEEERARV